MAIVACFVLAFSARARAGDAASPIAEQLFVESKALMEQGRYAEACEKLQASHTLDRTATGTLLNLALCHEHVNRPATAWAEFRQVAAESAVRREDRVALAREHEAKLFPILSRVTIAVPANARAPGLVVKIDDGLPIADVSWDTALTIDPGKHVVTASAPGKVAFRTEVVIGAVSDRQTVTIAPLADRPVAAAESSPVSRDPEREREASAREASERTRRIVGFAIGGAGLAAAGVGLVFGLVASGRNSDAKALCPDDRCPSEGARVEASSTLASADSAANVSNITVAAGGLLLAAGVVLVVTALPPRSTSAARASTNVSALRLAPMANDKGGGLMFGGDLW